MNRWAFCIQFILATSILTSISRGGHPSVLLLSSIRQDRDNGSGCRVGHDLGRAGSFGRHFTFPRHGCAARWGRCLAMRALGQA